MYKFLSVLLLFCIALIASIKPQHIEINIYKNISFTTKEYKLNGTKELSLHIPALTKLEEINIDTNKCKKESLQFSSIKPIDTKEKENLKDKISDLSNQIEGLKEEGKLLKTLSLKEKNQKNAQEILNFFTKNYISNLKHITTLEQELKRAKTELKSIEELYKQNYKILSARFVCTNGGTVSIKYPQYDFKVNSFYVIKGDAERGKINFIKKVKITQESDEDLKNIDIISHSNSYNKRVKPSTFFPKYLNTEPKMKLSYSSKPTKVMKLETMVQPVPQIRHKQNLTTSAFIVHGIDLLAFQDKIITLENREYKAIFKNDIDGYASGLAYLKGSFVSNKYYQYGEADVILENNRIGKLYMKDIKKGEKVDIYFGENQNIDIKKSLLKRFNESEFFGNSRIKTQVWQYKIKNLNSTIQKIDLMERIPISQDEDIKVEPLFDAKKAKIDKRGKVTWSFQLKPNETKIVKFGYKTTIPKR